MALATLHAALLLLPPPLSCQEEFPHPELDWKTVETEHFYVHYHDGAERTAQAVAKIAEDIYEPVTSLYDHVPDQKVSFIIKDYDDISNGAAYFYDNKIEIYATSMDFELRGTHNWLRNVVTHEFTHIVQIQTSMKMGRRVPAVYFQWLNYESERRPDVLYGYPNVIVSYPISGFAIPAWFAEGVSQYNRKELQYDFWDTHRDMILRSYALEGKMLSWEEMAIFGKTSLGNESSYNAGFAFVAYIAQRYGEEKLAEIARHLSSFGVVSIDEAIGRAIGRDGKEVYDEWRAELAHDYRRRSEPVRTKLVQGEPLSVDTAANIVDPEQLEQLEGMMRPRQQAGPNGPFAGPCCTVHATVGFANLYPVFSPDGNKVAYVSTKGGDYFSLSSLYIYDLETRKETLVRPGVRTAPAWSPDGRSLYYAKITRDNPHWSLQFDLYVYDLREEEETRLTSGKRAVTPAVSPDGTRLAFVVNADGTTNLATSAADGSDFRMVTSFSTGEQVYNPHWSPKGDRIVFDYSARDGRDVAVIRPDGSDLRFVVSGADDARCATFSPDGSSLLFSSDRTGIFNVYSMDLASGSIRQLSNVLGGAFYPTMSPSGEVVYSLYTSGGFKIYRLPPPERVPENDFQYLRSPSPLPYPYGEMIASAAGNTEQFDWLTLRSYDDTKLPQLEPRSYRPIFTSLTIVPFLRIDNYNPKATGIELLKPGVYLFSNDVLDKTGVFAGAALNARLERDLFLIFRYQGKVPLLYQVGLEPVATFELYNVSRKTDAVISLPASTIPVDVTYDLLEFHVALNQRALSQFSNVELRYAHIRYKSIIGSFINPENNQLIPASSDLYLIANNFFLTFTLDQVIPSRTMEINPVGRKVRLVTSLELNQFNGDGQYEVTSTGLQPVYKTLNFPRVLLSWREYLPFFVKDHTLTVKLQGGTIFGPAVDEYFDFYGGGLPGMKGYPFYSIGGNSIAVAGLEYRFPLIRNIGARFAQITFDKLYASVYGDVGNAWTGSTPSGTEFKTDAGIQLRLETFSFYAFPTRFFFDAAYGFTPFERYVSSVGQTVSYGRQWSFYFGMLFGFDLD